MKIRLYRGPFDGKVMEHPGGGMSQVVIRGPKPMTRRQKHEYLWDQMKNNPYLYDAAAARLPIICANYRIVMLGPGIPCQHPDGSIFYEWDQPRKKKS